MKTDFPPFNFLARQRRRPIHHPKLLAAAMQDLQARLEKLTTDAADCEIISKLASDPNKRATFARLAEQYTAMANVVRQEIAARKQAASQ